MKVTEDMITRAISAMEVREPDNLRTAIDDVLRRQYVRVALDAALADVPEPVVYRGELRRAEARIAELEAQLAEQREHQLLCTRAWQAAEEQVYLVREWRKGRVTASSANDWKRLDAILDGKVKP